MNKEFEKIIEKLEELFQDLNVIEVLSHVNFDSTIQNSLDNFLKAVTNEAIEIVKQEAEKYNNGWIPCSERLPDVPEGIEDDECPEFNVTIKGADQAATLKCASDGTWFDDLGYTYDVIAWQPLPQPYQPKGE